MRVIFYQILFLCHFYYYPGDPLSLSLHPFHTCTCPLWCLVLRTLMSGYSFFSWKTPVCTKLRISNLPPIYHHIQFQVGSFNRNESMWQSWTPILCKTIFKQPIHNWKRIFLCRFLTCTHHSTHNVVNSRREPAMNASTKGDLCDKAVHFGFKMPLAGQCRALS